MTKIKDGKTTFAYFAAFICLGLATAALGPTLPGLAEHTRTKLNAISFVFTAHALGYLLGSYMAGRFYDRRPGNPLIAMGLLVTAVMLALTPVVPLLWLLVLILLVSGFASGGVDVGGNTLLVWVHGRKVGPYMNALHFCFGVGAFLSPIIVALAVSASGDIVWPYWILALVLLPAAIWLLRLPSPTPPQSAAEERGDELSLSQPHAGLLILLIALLLFLYSGAEVSYGGWVFTYARAKDLADETSAAYLTSLFWGALTLGRLLAIPIAVRILPRWILFSALLGCLVCLSASLLWSNSLPMLAVGTFGLGLSMAPIFPTAISFAGRHVKPTGRTTAWFFVGASVGGMILPWLIGQLFESIGPQVTVVAIMLDLVFAMGVLGTLALYTRRA